MKIVIIFIRLDNSIALQKNWCDSRAPKSCGALTAADENSEKMHVRYTVYKERGNYVKNIKIRSRFKSLPEIKKSTDAMECRKRFTDEMSVFSGKMNEHGELLRNEKKTLFAQPDDRTIAVM